MPFKTWFCSEKFVTNCTLMFFHLFMYFFNMYFEICYSSKAFVAKWTLIFLQPFVNWFNMIFEINNLSKKIVTKWTLMFLHLFMNCFNMSFEIWSLSKVFVTKMTMMFLHLVINYFDMCFEMLFFFQNFHYKLNNDVPYYFHALFWYEFWDEISGQNICYKMNNDVTSHCHELCILRFVFLPRYFLQNEHWCSFTFSWTDLKCVSRQSFILSICYKMNTDEASAYLLLELVLGIFSYLGLEQSCTYWDKQFNIYLNNGLPWLVFFRDTQICFQINISSSFQLVVNLPVLLCKQALYNLSGRL